MVRVVEVKVTWRDIWFSEQLNGRACMLAIAINRALGVEDATVGTAQLRAGGLWINLPALAQRKRHAYDHHIWRVTPFTFNLEVSDYRPKESQNDAFD